MRFLIYIFSALMLFIIVTSTEAGWTNHGKGLVRIHSAWNQDKDSLRLSSHASSFFKNAKSKSSENITSAVTYWDVQGGWGFRYGLTDHFELGISQIVYQDNHKGGKGFNIPDDLFLYAKIGSLGSRDGNFRLGLQLNSRIPITEYHNLPFEPYSAGRIELGLMGLLTFSSEPLFPDYGVNVHINTGVLSHNDIGTILTNSDQDTVTANQSSQEFLYGLGFSRMWNEWGIFLEVYGRNFLQKPPVTAYTRENSLYIMPGLIYQSNSWLSFHVGLDLRVSQNDDDTDYNQVQKISDELPNLPTWRICVGASISLTPNPTQPTIMYSPQEVSPSNPASNDTQIYQALADERRRTESAEEELERIRSERQRMEQMLERLRRILEWPSESTQDNQEEDNSDTSTP